MLQRPERKRDIVRDRIRIAALPVMDAAAGTTDHLGQPFLTEFPVLPPSAQLGAGLNHQLFGVDTPSKCSQRHSCQYQHWEGEETPPPFRQLYA